MAEEQNAAEPLWRDLVGRRLRDLRRAAGDARDLDVLTGRLAARPAADDDRRTKAATARGRLIAMLARQRDVSREPILELHDRLVAAGYRLWKPTKAEPLNLEDTVEAYLREVYAQGGIRTILVDPWQAARSIQTLKAAGLPIEEFPQTDRKSTRLNSSHRT